MQLKYKLHLDFEEFLRDGKFDYIQLGKTKEWIINNFPDPDAPFLDQSIWLYGNIEFHFDGDMLFLIHLEKFKDLDVSDKFHINPWFLGTQYRLKDILHELNQKHMDYYKVTRDFDGTIELVMLKSKVKLFFTFKEDFKKNMTENRLAMEQSNQGEFILTALSYSNAKIWCNP